MMYINRCSSWSPPIPLTSIDQFYYNLADYVVHIVTTDALEPVILGLKKIEDYEFAQQLQPGGT